MLDPRACGGRVACGFLSGPLAGQVIRVLIPSRAPATLAVARTALGQQVSTAKIGWLTLPRSLLARADQVIQ